MRNAATQSQPERVPLSRGEYVLILLFWTFYAGLAVAGALLDPRGRFGQTSLQLGQIVFPLIQAYLWAGLTPLIFWLVASVGMGRQPQLRRVLLLLAAGLATALLADVVLALIRFELLPPPASRRRFSAPPFGPLEGIKRLWFLDDYFWYLAVVAAGFAREYSLRLRLRQAEAVRLQAEASRLSSQLAESRLAALRTQLDPHFLFNTLHAVSALVTQDPRGVRRMISRLSELLRRSLEGAGGPEVPLREELDFVGSYLEIMQIRFQDRLEVSTRAEPAALDGLVPTLVLQPLVENAVKHGMGEAAEEGRIEIEARREGADLVLAVEDSGPGPVSVLSEGLGIRNTRERLEALYGEAQSLTLGAGRAGGFRAEVRLPYHTAGDLRATSSGAL